MSDVGKKSDLQEKWSSGFEKFMTSSMQSNATFVLHNDIMIQYNEITGAHLAERLGGHPQYSLPTGLVKQSLSFAYLHGASQ